jgi:diguanylate cyclase (GGDEF)-like protein
MIQSVIQLSAQPDLIRKLEVVANEHRIHSQDFALLMVGLQNFRQFNIIHGFAAGDILLAKFFDRLNCQLRAQDMILRSGSAEFVIVIQNILNEGHATLAVIKLMNVLDEAFDISGVRLRVSACIGVSLFPYHGQDVSTLLKNTETALVEARDKFPAYSIYEDSVNNEQALNWDIAPDLQSAIDLDQLELFFQPQIEIASGRMHGAEVLLRWKHHDRGYIDPETFISVAEQGELIYDITDWLIHSVLWQMQDWADMPVSPQIAVNLSPKILKYPGLVESISNSANIFGSDLKQVTLEVTESALVEDLSFSTQYLEELKSLGVKISIDDFGTGYSSIAYFKKIPADELKIDRSFVSNMIESQADQHIVKSVINMAQGFNLKVVAEGIENVETLELLKSLGCDIGQGYYIAKPMPKADFVKMLQHYSEQILLP